MVIRLGRNGRFLACSLYPEHKETRPLPGEEAEQAAVEGVGETCPQCGEGTLVAKRGRFGAFAGCSRYPDCNYIRKTGPPPPEPLPFEVTCPKCGEGTADGAPSAPDRAASSGAARATRSATSRRRASRSARSTMRTTGPVAREGEAAASASSAARRSSCPRS